MRVYRLVSLLAINQLAIEPMNVWTEAWTVSSGMDLDSG